MLSRIARLLSGRCSFFMPSGLSSTASTQVSRASPAPQNGRASWYMTSGECCSVRIRSFSRWNRCPPPRSAGSAPASGNVSLDRSAVRALASRSRRAPSHTPTSTSVTRTAQACQGLTGSPVNAALSARNSRPTNRTRPAQRARSTGIRRCGTSRPRPRSARTSSRPGTAKSASQPWVRAVPATHRARVAPAHCSSVRRACSACARTRATSTPSEGATNRCSLRCSSSITRSRKAVSR